MHTYTVFKQYERNHWQLNDIAFSKVRRELVRPEYLTMAKSGGMRDSNVIAAVHRFLNELTDDYDFSTCAVVWGYQDVQHHYAFKSWRNAVDEYV